MSQIKALPTAPIQLINKVAKCRCMCYKVPNWNIPSVANMYGDSGKSLPLTGMKLKGKIDNSIAVAEFTQVFHNDTTSPLECIYKFPTDPNFVVAGLIVKMDDKEIQAEVMEKAQAEEKYDDAVAAGHTAVKMNHDKKLPDIIELNVGAIQPDKTVEVVIKLVMELEVTKHGFYSFIFPIEFIPKYGDTEGILGQGGSLMPAKFELDLDINATSTITNLSVSHEGISHEQSEDGKSVHISLKSDENLKARDLVISYSYDSIREPQVKLTRCQKYPDQIAAHISFIPRCSEEHDNDDEESKTTEEGIFEVEDKDDPEVASGEFIFIIDRSGSMGGDRIRTACQSLILFIRSLPANCLFNVVSFGSDYSFMFPQSVEYTNNNMNKAIEDIETFSSDFGGTELLGPIEDVLKQDINHQHPRNIFVLTDGAISNTQSVLDVIEKNDHKARVHSFGIGSGASKYLVNELASTGKGSSTHIADNDPLIKSKVIRALKLASKPAFTNMIIDWKDNGDAVKLCVPESPHISNIYEEEPFNVYAVILESTILDSDIVLKFFNTLDQTEESVILQFDSSKIVDSEEGYEFQLAARRFIDFTKKFSTEEDKDKTIKNTAIEYQVLDTSGKTAFFGKIKNKHKSKEEMQTVEIPVKSLDTHQARPYHYGAPSMIRSLAKGSHDSIRLQRSEMMFKSEAPKQNSNQGFFSKIGSAVSGLFGSRQKKSADRDMCLAAPPKRVMAAAPPRDAIKYSKESAQSSNVSKKFNLEAGSYDSDDDEEELEGISSKMSKPRRSSGLKTRSIDQSYMDIVSLQDSSGYFIDLPPAYKHLLSIDAPSDLDVSTDIGKNAWVTILSIAILKKHHKESEGEWTMIAKKAESYLKMNKVKDYKNLIKNALELV